MALPPGPTDHAAVTIWHWLHDPIEYFDGCKARFGPAFTVHLPGLPPLVVFSDPADVKEIFADDGDTLLGGRFNLSLRAFLGDRSVLMLDGKEHRRQRRLLLPPFQGDRMHAYGRVMIDAAHASLDRWPLRRPFPIHGEMQWITLQVILRAVFGMDEGEHLTELSHRLTELLDIAAWAPLMIPYFQKDLGPWSPWGRFLRKTAVVSALLLEQIRRRRAEGPGDRTDILSLLLAARDEETGHVLTDEELRDELVTLLVAGHETTASAIAWTFRWILATPRVEDRLRAEIEGVDLAAPERVAKLDYLDAVTREALRLQPVVPLCGRMLEVPARVGGWDLPAGVAVICSIGLAHRRPEVYADPLRFNPDRFLGTKVSPHEFYPFGGGVRRCIGMAFALYEMKMVLATVLSRARLRLADGGVIRVARRSITLTPSGGMRVVLTNRAPRPERGVPQASLSLDAASPS